ncbi:MAG: D-alanyl-D-alanine carboxypeptidase, partial [Leptolyngbyaceae cyanobacterium SM1_3_5]|nr:D-alanyl-D-alanine carboxypeptidase [Leptolyngbyaceae cyanobacterium SM1_3_5]
AIDIGGWRESGHRLAAKLSKHNGVSLASAKMRPRYGFEMSFPHGNPQGVSYEPWHWRFVGDRTSLETFYRARSQPRSQP